MDDIQKYLGTIIQIATIGGMAFLIFRTFRDPDIKADKELGINAATCGIKHKIIDQKFESITQELTLIKENHLKHIENDISTIKTNIAIILDREDRPKQKI
jgi:hypothetical protein